jgi:hypothetical protein
MHSTITEAQAGVAVVFTSIASALVNLPIIMRRKKTRPAMRKLLLSALLQLAAGAVVLAFQIALLH